MSREVKVNEALLEALERARRDPVFFVIAFLGETPDPYQAKVLKSVAEGKKRLVLVFGRQVGKSTVSSWVALWYSVTHSGKNVLVTAPTRDQAQIIFNRIRNYLEGSPALYSLVKRATQTEIWLRNGTKILVKPSFHDARYLRGKTVDFLIVDECAFVNDEVWAVLNPMIITRYDEAYVLLISTPFGNRNYFAQRYYESFKPGSKWTSFHYPSTVCPRISLEALWEEYQRLPELTFRQEYLAEFVEEADLYFPPSIVTNNIRDYRAKRITELVGSL